MFWLRGCGITSCSNFWVVPGNFLNQQSKLQTVILYLWAEGCLWFLLLVSLRGLNLAPRRIVLLLGLCFWTSLLLGFLLLGFIDFGLSAFGLHCFWSFCFWASLLLGFLLLGFIAFGLSAFGLHCFGLFAFGLLDFCFLHFEVAFYHLVVSTFGVRFSATTSWR